jgi:hypothetical protein
MRANRRRDTRPELAVRRELSGFSEMHCSVLAHTYGMPVRLHYIVVDAHDLLRLAQFWAQALGWQILSEREREIVIGTDDNASVGICFMPVTERKVTKNRVHLDLTSGARDRDQEIDRLLALGARGVDIGQTGAETLKATSSAWCARRKRSPVDAGP